METIDSKTGRIKSRDQEELQMNSLHTVERRQTQTGDAKPKIELIYVRKLCVQLFWECFKSIHGCSSNMVVAQNSRQVN